MTNAELKENKKVAGKLKAIRNKLNMNFTGIDVLAVNFNNRAAIVVKESSQACADAVARFLRSECKIPKTEILETYQNVRMCGGVSKIKYWRVEGFVAS